MATFEDIQAGARLRGLDAAGVADIVQVTRFGPDALNLVFRVGGRMGERLVYRGEEIGFEALEAGRTYAFDADGGLLRLASEAYRLRLAHLFDPYLAVSASQIEALPHQITAVYGEMLPRQPLRFLLADDPGAGKTVMAGLLIKELLIRGDLERCLIVAPGSLVEQWQEEMSEKFGLAFDVLFRDQIENSVSGNPFAERNRLIVRLDMAARSDDLKAKLLAAPEWDLVICDEAHRMAASYFGGEVKETQRHKLGKLLGGRARNFLLMSATPHNGKEADFQLFMGLLDADRFEGRFREGVHKADVSDMMRRLTKEELYHFDGTPLFPERRAYTASYELSPAEADRHNARNFVSMALEARNAVSHLTLPLQDDEALRYLDAMLALLRLTKAAPVEVTALKALYDAQPKSGAERGSAAVETPQAARPQLTLTPADGPARALKPWTEVALPHPDVIANRFKEAEFAADHGDDEVPLDPKHFALLAFLDNPGIFDAASDLMALEARATLAEYVGMAEDVEPRLGAFAQICFQHHASRLARQRRREAAAVVVSLDAPLPGHPEQCLGDTFAETDGLSAWLGQPTDAAAVVELRIDLANALQSVDPADVPLCVALVDQRADEVAQTGPQSRATVYRRVREIRLRLLVAGMASWA